MGTVQDIIFKEDQGPPSLPIAVLISFDNYKGPTITSLESERVVPIVPIRRIWNGKSKVFCSCMQVPICLAWTITMHKSQDLTLRKAKIDLGDKEFTAGLSFVAAARTLEDLILSSDRSTSRDFGALKTVKATRG